MLNEEMFAVIKEIIDNSLITDKTHELCIKHKISIINIMGPLDYNLRYFKQHNSKDKFYYTIHHLSNNDTKNDIKLYITVQNSDTTEFIYNTQNIPRLISQELYYIYSLLNPTV